MDFLSENVKGILLSMLMCGQVGYASYLFYCRVITNVYIRKGLFSHLCLFYSLVKINLIL